MTSPAHALHGSAAHPATAHAGPLDRLPAVPVRLIFAVGLPMLAVLMALTWFDVGGQRAAWENTHWTLSSAVAAAAAAFGAREAHGLERRVRGALALGLTSYFLGQIVWNLQIVWGLHTVPAPSDLLFLFTAVPVACALVIWIRSVRSNERFAAYLDGATLFLMITTVIFAVYGSKAREESDPLAGATLLAYPVVFLASAGAGFVAAMATRAQPRLHGAYALLIGFAMLGASWVVWLQVALDEIPAPGSSVNYLFSMSLVVIAVGAATWSSVQSTGRGYDRVVDSVLGALPIAAVLLSAGLLILPVGDNGRFDLVNMGALAVIVVALTREGLVLQERTSIVGRERDALERERQSGEKALNALRAQRESEARYRSAVEIFNRLADQITFAGEEADLIRAATAAINQLVPSPRGEVLLLSASQNRLVVSRAWGSDAPQAGSVIDVDSPLRCPGLRRGSVHSLSDAEDELLLHCPAHRVEHGSALCVPMLALGQAVGVIHLERPEPNAFDDDNQRQAARVAEQIALAIANARLMRTMEGLAMTDPLTGLSNARFFDPYLDKELAAAERDGEHLGVIMIDLDQFKRFNDTYGHPAGDEALRAFARTASSVVRRSDTIARYGGEEFVVSVRHADLQQTTEVAEKIRAGVEQAVIEVGPGRFGRITISAGVASTSVHGRDRVTLIRTADRALYEAKQRGRNRVVAADGALEELGL